MALLSHIYHVAQCRLCDMKLRLNRALIHYTIYVSIYCVVNHGLTRPLKNYTTHKPTKIMA